MFFSNFLNMLIAVTDLHESQTSFRDMADHEEAINIGYRLLKLTKMKDLIVTRASFCE